MIQAKGIKQRFIAQKLGVSEVSVSNWVKGKTNPSEEHMEKLGQLLEVPLEKLRNVL